LAIAFSVGLAALMAQEAPLDPHSSIKINFPPDSPLALISANMGESRAASRGSAVVLDLHMALSLRNVSANRVRGVTLLVLAQEVTPGGKASVSVPSIDVASGQVFPVRIDLRLLRPAQVASGPLVQIDLDGVLFQDLSFYGPNRLDSRRVMTATDMEAPRDRQYFKSVLAAHGAAGLQREVLESLARQSERPHLNVQVSRGRAVSSAALGAERLQQFAFLQFPDSPVRPIDGSAQIFGSEARAPNIQVLNRSHKAVRYVEIGWLVRDSRGNQFMAASVPASGPELYLPPGRTARVLQDSSLKFARDGGQPLSIDGMTGFVSQVEYADGKVWIPNRSSLEQAKLLGVVGPSPEEQRLTDLYRKKGLNALIEELRKF